MSARLRGFFFCTIFRVILNSGTVSKQKKDLLKHAVLIAVLIIAVGAVFRFWRLGSLADGMAWDEAYKGLDALAIRQFGERPVFLNWNAGREALIAYLVAASQYFFDYSIVSVRAVLAFFGVLTLVFVFLLSRRLFNDRVALIATFLLAVSKWHIMHSGTLFVLV